MVRDVATRLNQDERISAYVVESENVESIHDHSAYALIERDRDKQLVGSLAIRTTISALRLRETIS